jgi:hypothetical protein
MNCKQFQEQMLNAFAAGETLVSREVDVHRNSCPACGALYVQQQTLFRALDAGVHSIANEPVPPSFLPAVRARLDAQPHVSGMNFPGWSLALAAALVVLVLSLVWGARHSKSLPDPSLSAVVPAQVTPPAPARTGEEPPAPATVIRVHRTEIAVAERSADPSQEIIVLAQEREAYAKFIASSPTEKSVALTLVHPVPEAADAMEIKPIEISDVEVKPLEGSPGR